MENTIKRVMGSAGAAPIVCINPRRNKWRIRWDMRPEERDSDLESRPEAAPMAANAGPVTYMEAEFDHRPSLEEVREVIIGWHNDRIDRAIREGFRWQETPVWLSAQNQFNYKAAFDLAIQTDGANLPVVFKFGTDEKPVYREFTTIDELKNFYTAAMAHIKQTLADGWNMKDSIDFSVYATE